MERLGIFGGTFDPPHLAHVILATEAAAQLSLERVLWVLTPDPPHKQGQNITPWAIRLEMVLAAMAGHLGFELSRVEINRLPPHYAVDTVRLLRQEHPAAELVYLIGGDSLSDLPCWYTPKEFIHAVDELGVMLRPGQEGDLTQISQALPEALPKVRWVQAPLLDISSTAIRSLVKNAQPYRAYLPAGVYALIETKQLYRD